MRIFKWKAYEEENPFNELVEVANGFLQVEEDRLSKKKIKKFILKNTFHKKDRKEIKEITLDQIPICRKVQK